MELLNSVMFFYMGGTFVFLFFCVITDGHIKISEAFFWPISIPIIVLIKLVKKIILKDNNEVNK